MRSRRRYRRNAGLEHEKVSKERPLTARILNLLLFCGIAAAVAAAMIAGVNSRGKIEMTTLLDTREGGTLAAGLSPTTNGTREDSRIPAEFSYASFGAG